ncbi:MAG: carbohydrate ABC transporter permease [Anaerocolumna sp.]
MNIKIRKYSKGQIFWGLAMVAPTIIGLFILNIYPFIQTIYLSFCETGDFGKNIWIGFDNYKRFIGDSLVWVSTKNTIIYVILTVPGGVILALIFANLLHSNIKGKGIYRAIFFLPIVCAPAAIAMVWKWLFNTDFGLINQMLSYFGISSIAWLTNPKLAIISVSLVTVWSSMGYDIILILAGLQGIPKSNIEAAKIDGANSFQIFKSVTIPLVSPTLFFVLIMRLMSSLKQFDLIYMLVDEKNPALEGAQTLTYLFYRQAFVIKDKGYASVIVLWTFVLIAGITLFQFITEKKWVHYE